MKIRFSVLLFTSILFSIGYGNLQGPDDELLDKSKQYERKSSKVLEQETSTENEKTSTEETDENSESEPFIKILAEDLNFPSSGIKIVKAPDLSKDSDNKKISETLTMMLESQEKWIQKFEEELEEMNKNESPEEPEVEKTAEEIEGKT
jgi:cysteinyl-tRNA synthetase